jgi:hypothetical protein
METGSGVNRQHTDHFRRGSQRGTEELVRSYLKDINQRTIGMMLFLFIHISDPFCQRGFGNAEYAIFFLPCEFARQKLFVDAMRTGTFQMPNNGSNSQPRWNGKNNVQMVRHSVDGMGNTFQCSDFSSQVAIQVFFPG